MKQNRKKSLEARLAAYGSMSLALAAIGMPATASASLITTNDITTTLSTPVYFDLYNGTFALGGTGGLDDFELVTRQASSAIHAYLFAKGTQFNASSLNGNKFAVTGSSSFGSVAKLAPGVSVVGPTLNFATQFGTLASNLQSPATPFGQWNGLPASGDVGLSIVRSGNTYYGWANIVVNSDYTVTLKAFGFNETPDASQLAGDATPEPSSIVLLALGAAGIAAYRRKKVAS